MKQLAMRFTPIMMQCDSIQHNAIWCNTEKYMQWKKYGHFYLFDLDRQQIIN